MRRNPFVKLTILPLALCTLFAGHTPSVLAQNAGRIFASAKLHGGYMEAVSYTHLTLPTIYSV